MLALSTPSHLAAISDILDAKAIIMIIVLIVLIIFWVQYRKRQM